MAQLGLTGFGGCFYHTPGSPGHALWLDVARQDLVVLKRRFGAFVPGLQERGIDTLIISGTLSQVCCEATARDACLRNTDRRGTRGTLSAMAHRFCDVRDTRSVLGLIAATSLVRVMSECGPATDI
jgi:ureidoacrylate peracid hydrolase